MGSPAKGQVVYASEKPFAPAVRCLHDDDLPFLPVDCSLIFPCKSACEFPAQSGGSLWDGDFDEEANAKAFQAARDAWKRGVPLDEEEPEKVAFSASSAVAAVDSTAPSKPAAKSLWDGEFDEEANANAFKAARDAWKKGVDLVDEFSEKRAPAPAAASGKSALAAQPKFAASESLLHGHFDELGNRRAFQEARIAWLESQKREAKKDAGTECFSMRTLFSVVNRLTLLYPRALCFTVQHRRAT